MMKHAVLFAMIALHAGVALAQLPSLRVSENHRFLVTADGKPFFWLGDTAWELFHRLNREAADRYLENRAKKGFNVVQAVAIAELDGDTVPNADGDLPFVDLDPTRPDVKDRPAHDYWQHVDYVVNKANSLGIYVAMLPTWGRYWHDKPQRGRLTFNRQTAEAYGRWLGNRYKDKALIWILGGDRSVDDDEQREIIRAMARGLKAGDGGANLMTLHPSGGNGSAHWFHDDQWLDFDMRQNGHGIEWTGHYENTANDYRRSPPKPVIDGEPVYEDHPVSFNAAKLGYSVAADVRRALYWDLFSGAFGHTNGHHSVWQMWAPGRKPVNNPLMPWFEAIDQPGAGEMQYGRRLIESRPFLSRIPDDGVIVDDDVKTAVPGEGTRHFAATRDASGSYAMIYAPVGRPFKVRMDKITGAKVIAWWFDPRNGEATRIGTFDNTAIREFTPPEPGELADWVLVLDDAAKRYPPPGGTKSPRVEDELAGYKLLVTSVRTGDTEVFVVNPATGDARNLSRSPRSEDRYPCWSPDGKHVAFTSNRDWPRHDGPEGPYSLYVMDVDGNNVRRLVDQDAVCYMPSWQRTAQGDRIVFGLHGAKPQMASIRPDGTELKMLGEGHDPTLSPDGKSICYTGEVSGGVTVFVMDADGRNKHQVIRGVSKVGATFPNWSPDSRQIVYSFPVGGALELFVINADGTGNRQLTRTGKICTPAAWSPDGKWISFRSTDERYWSDKAKMNRVYAEKPAGKRPVWVIRPDGSDAHVIECLRFQCAIDGSRAAWKP